MPHATVEGRPARRLRPTKKASDQGSKSGHELQRKYDDAIALYYRSGFSRSVDALLRARHAIGITKIVSLGLGSMSERSKDQPRRFKQLAILKGIAAFFAAAGQSVEIFAQDPSFTKHDAQFLRTLGIQILRTPATSELGEAAHIMDAQTLVYSPFLTLAAYRLLLDSGIPVDFIIGDDFRALRAKWEKTTSEYKEVDRLTKTHISHYQRRALKGDGFWEVDDGPFPMAMYWKFSEARNDLPKRTELEKAKLWS